MEAKNPSSAPEQQHPWLAPFLMAQYYGVCQTHEHIKKVTTNCNHFCTSCLVPICEYCKNSPQHNGHFILQVRRASYFSSIAVGDVENLIDTDGLHIFKINGTPIHFIRARSSEGSKRKAPLKGDTQCEVCRWTLPGGCDETKRNGRSRFCSIECKLLPGSSSSPPRAAGGAGPGEREARIVLTSAGRTRRVALGHCTSEAVAVSPVAKGGLPVGGHGKKRSRDKISGRPMADPGTSTAVPALKNNGVSYEEKMTKEKKKRRHENSKTNRAAVAADPMEKPALEVNIHNSFRVRQRKVTPHRSIEFVTPDERTSLWFFPW